MAKSIKALCNDNSCLLAVLLAHVDTGGGEVGLVRTCSTVVLVVKLMDLSYFFRIS